MLAGGAARRLGGVDKPGVRVGGRPLLDRVLAACAGARRTVVVGDPRPTVRPVRWTREERARSGPLAALDAGVTALLPSTDAGTATGGATAGAPEVLLALSADLPFLGDATVRRLLAALDAAPDAEAALFTDPEGRDQPLVAAYRTAPLRRALDGIRRAHQGLDDLPLRLLGERLRPVRVPSDPEEPLASFDCDTWEDIATARARIRDHGAVLDEWITAVKTELGIDLDVDTGVLLDLARDAAHGVARPAAPLTTFLVGYAAAKAAGDGTAPAEAVAEASRKAAALAQRWAAEQDEAG
ncbi:molybdenum cofactor guanylyltransferase [Streptomyces filamentosus]|uniref:Molybdenum cofactor guanylyltransferase n=1 Tax=Streptomyces filamentosus TaxID=67294 RepID=A0A919BJF4_STRFL|nr:molybdenum cofactor guanylyltransferase [Streptomyces filamentosus]